MLRVAEPHWELWGLMRQLAMIARKSEAPTPREAAQLLSKPLCATGAGGMCVRVAKYRSDLLNFLCRLLAPRENGKEDILWCQPPLYILGSRAPDGGIIRRASHA